MNPNPFDQHLREVIVRRPLTVKELAELQQWLAAHPEARADWEAELALSRALSRQPDAPAPSNLTARVLAEIAREEKDLRRERAGNGGGWLRVFLPRFGVGTAVVVALAVFFHQRNESARRSELAQNLSTFAAVRTLPTVEMLEDFEAIRSLNIVASADEDILSLNDELQSLQR